MIRQPFAPQPLRKIATLIHFINCCTLYSVGCSIFKKKCRMQITDYCSKRLLHKSAFWFSTPTSGTLTQQKRVAMRDEEKRRAKGRNEIVVRMLPSRRGESDLIVAYAITPAIALTLLVSGWYLLARCAEITAATSTWYAPTSSGPANVGQRKRQRLANDPVEHGWR